MPFLRLLLFLILVVLLAACNQIEQNNEGGYKKNLPNYIAENKGKSSDRNDSIARTGGIIAGSLDVSLEIKGDVAIFKIKNQTEQVKELILSDETSYE
ncbi:hypothetical protein, partial [Virgibacillus sp. DJP39]|uniref:hypothetical protein n=1 Tax=Virgibacillus sp. DJP39 TaxID=3409790 RepID=UPI003BB6D370